MEWYYWIGIVIGLLTVVPVLFAFYARLIGESLWLGFQDAERKLERQKERMSHGQSESQTRRA